MKEIKANVLEGKYEDILAAVQSPVIALSELIKNSADSCLDKDEPILIKICTKDKTIEVIDKGEGLCQDEIERLGEAGYSSKMVGDKTTSPINNSLAGNKGLGLLTTFFISDSLEITTYSVKDKQAYFIEWQKGEQKYRYDIYEKKIVGTRIFLKNIDDEKMKMILLPEEKVKLFMTSLRFFTGASNQPKIKLFIDGEEESFYPDKTLEDYYAENKRDNYGFIAKASFKYEKNKVILSYEDNITSFYTFNNMIIDLEDTKSVEKFALDINAPEKGSVPIKKINESDLFGQDYVSVKVPAFSGVFYTWRSRKENELEQWPSGVRIYINNYSLYRYLDKDNDWLNLSEVSQNVKATNYKLKNTYGYLDIDKYNENEESLKISKERNDFVDSLAQRKFVKIMREIIVAIFTRIDMATKNPPIKSLGIRQKKVTVRMGEQIDLKKYVICKNIGLDDINIECDKTTLSFDEDWNIRAHQKGVYVVKLSYEKNCFEISLEFKEKIPEFSLTKGSETVYKGNSINLRDYIVPKSCKDVQLVDISIVPEKSTTKILNDFFDKDNFAGQHVILYQYASFQQTLILNVKEITRQPDGGTKSPRIDGFFPKLDSLREKSFKIPELIDGISSYYVEVPTLCMAAIRILVEASCKTFFQYLKNEEIHFSCSFKDLVNKTMDMQSCIEKAPEYEIYIATQDANFIHNFMELRKIYNTILSRDVKNNIKNTVKQIDLNMFVHNPSVVSTDVTVYKTMQVFSPLLNFVFDVLLIEKGDNVKVYNDKE